METRELYDFIRAQRYGVVSSLHADGAPQSALVGIAVSADLELIFDTTDATRKCPNLRRDPRVAVVIGWDNEQTLQYEGIADEPGGDELVRLKQIYFEAWPDGPTRESWPGITYWRTRPRWIRYSSYLRPQRIEEVRFQPRT